MNKTFYLTTPIYYVNDLPHIGHAYTTVAADILARWHRLNGEDVFYLTGTDEHGAKIAQAAEKAGRSPKDFCDEISLAFKSAWERLNITNNSFIRTTDEKHLKAVEAFLKKLFDSGAVYKKKYEGLYCVQCERFLTKIDLEESNCCPIHKTEPMHHSEENYFFRLSVYREELINLLTDENHPHYLKVSPIERRNEVVGKLKTGLEDISISRANLEWGIPLPFDTSQTAYVWVDALLNYISGIGYGQKDTSFKKYWPAQLHLMAKDILWFHSVIWPALLLATGLPLPKEVFAHGFFTINGDKMSKTLGNVIKPDDLIERFGLDASRYLLVSLFPFGSDGDISWKSLIEKYNTDLANNLGNLVSRTLTMVEKYSSSIVPDVKAPSDELMRLYKNKLISIEKTLDKLEFHRTVELIQAEIDISNRYIEEKAPWKMAKQQNPELPNVLFSLLQNLGLIALYLVPFMPDISQKIWESIGETEPVDMSALNYIKSDKGITFPHTGSHIKKPGVLFPRIK